MRAAATCVAALVCVCATAQAQSATGYTAPRTSDGRPDLQGVWSNQSLTNLNRPPGVSALVVSAEEAASIVANNPWIQLAQSEAGASDLDDGLLDDGNSDRGYNTFWIDPGQTLGKVRGEYRTSWIVEPADGRMPLSEAGRAKVREDGARRRSVLFAGPESLPIAERCLIGFTGAGGPGMLNTIYNNNYQIVQTPDAVMILVEMVHDARIIRLEGEHRPPAMRQWLGDSVGRWEGDTLVVETVNVHPEQGAAGPVYLSESGRVVERFTRTAEDQIHYEFEVVDPVYYTTPWRAEMTLNARREAVYEYACHEGNYAMPGILGGARVQEAKGIQPTMGPGIFPSGQAVSRTPPR
jgi:hypothetical protein